MIRPLCLATLLLVAPLAAQQTERFTLAGSEVAIYNLVGALSVVGGNGPEVVVNVTRSGLDAGRLTVDHSPVRGLPALRIVFPGARIVYPAMGRHSNTQLTIREDGTWGGGDWDRHRDGSHQIRISGDGDGLEASARMDITVPAGRKVRLFVGVGSVDIRNVDGTLLVDVASANITSSATQGNFILGTGSGDIEVSNHDGGLSLDTGSGDIAVTTQKNGALNIDTGSGSVRTSGITASTIKIDTGSGDIRLGDVTATRASLETGSGSIEARFRTPVEDLSVETGSGDVLLRLPDGLNVTVDLETSSGDLTVDFPVQLIHKEDSSLRGRIGDGRGQIRVESGSGDISLLK